MIGFSQTMNWYGDVGDPTTFEQRGSIETARWQLWWHAGSGIESWADAAYEGWDLAAAGSNLVSPCASASANPDRVVLTISSNLHDEATPPATWAATIESAISTTRAKFSAVRQIILQPVVGGPNNGRCAPDGDRASSNHPIIDQAIALISQPGVVAGPSPEVAACSEFSDEKGHLAPSARPDVAAAIASCYAP